MTQIDTPQDAWAFLDGLGAPKRLITHLQMVEEAASALILELDRLKLEFDSQFVRLGAAVHDAGKIQHPEELDQPGHLHENAGEAFLLDQGFAPAIARCCRSHAQFDEMQVSLEELIVALADKLWKGSRKAELELRVIDGVADRLGVTRWDVFEPLDACFERIASDADARLMRSQ